MYVEKFNECLTLRYVLSTFFFWLFFLSPVLFLLPMLNLTSSFLLHFLLYSLLLLCFLPSVRLLSYLLCISYSIILLFYSFAAFNYFFLFYYLLSTCCRPHPHSYHRATGMAMTPKWTPVSQLPSLLLPSVLVIPSCHPLLNVGVHLTSLSVRSF